MENRDINIFISFLEIARTKGIIQDTSTRTEKRLNQFLKTIENKLTTKENIELENLIEDYKLSSRFEQFKYGGIVNEIIETIQENWSPIDWEKNIFNK